MANVFDNIYWQVYIRLSVENMSEEKSPYRLYLHNKDQMIFHKVDEIFGSKRINVDKGHNYKIKRTRWKALDSPVKRCTDQGAKANTTQCVTNYIENTIGCSMGLSGSDPQIPM